MRRVSHSVSHLQVYTSIFDTLRHGESLTTPLASEANKVKFKKEAQIFAARDSKRAVRESGMYHANELEAIDGDEKHGNQVL